MNTKKIVSTILVIIWMVTIFYFSHQQGAGSSNISKKVSDIMINIIDIKNEINFEKKEKMVEKLEPYVRKIAHLTIYMLGGLLLISCINTYKISNNKSIISSSCIGIFYAITDEIHQLFVNGRSGRLVDVLIDSIGVFIGIVAYLIIIKIVKNRKCKLNKKETGGE